MEITDKFSLPAQARIKAITMMAMPVLFHIYKEKKIPARSLAKLSSFNTI